MSEKHAFSAEISKILKLMIHSLYTNKDIFLRELISNASDACDKLRYQAVTEPALLGDDSRLRITLSVDKEASTITVADNGIGMSREELIANLGTIAKSGTQEFLSSLSGDAKKDMPLIGQFGVGFYSAFVVADKITVTSRKAGEERGHVWESAGEGEFSITGAESAPRGTSITLHIKQEDSGYLDKFRLQHIAQTYSDHISFPIEFVEKGEAEVINKGSALWMRPKSDITPEQYAEFYHHVAHLPDSPWMTLHNKAEGTIEYTSLLFIPSMQPFDLFHPDRKRSVKLYVRRVFITEEGTELVPHYLRFLRGVVDSEDLPLNISRETLQHNPMLGKIRDAIVKRVLGELKKRAGKDAEDYAVFWKHFGAVLKEGLCESVAPKEEILDACRFASTQGDGLVSLETYISRMKEGQDTIFYLTGERTDALLVSPQLEGFRKRGIEVLLLSDHVDDFWVNVVHEYKGKAFKSVTRSNIDLDTIGTEEEQAKSAENAKQDAAMEPLVAQLKALFGDAVKDVRVTHKLAESAVCLAVEDGAMDIRFERFLREQKQLATTYAKILEINPSHPVIKSLAEKVARGATPQDETFSDTAWVLFDQAKILEGEEITDPAAFSRRINQFLSRTLNAA